MRTLSASFVRFAVVGVLSNAALYLAYLALTRAGMGPKAAMTLAFALGTIATFAANRTWSFRSRTPAAGAFARYVATYAAGYGINLVALVVLVDVAGWPHEWVQGAMIVLLALFTFAAQRFWVFAGGAGDVTAPR